MMPRTSPGFLPFGHVELRNHCLNIYPDQQDVKQLKALRSYINGGNDPLDYITIYRNDGNCKDIPRHWHYVSCGLSDIYGIGAHSNLLGFSYPPSDNGEVKSGFGFELTFRLKNDDEPDDTNPPIWPATVMQEMARYVYQTKNLFSSGDYAAWHCLLDGSESNIRHVLLTDDPQLGEAHTSYGKVNFIQIVGVCNEELKAAQQWQVASILDIMAERVETGGRYLVTDMRRVETIFDFEPDAVREKIDQGIANDGSNLISVEAKCMKWSEKEPKWLVKPKITSDSPQEHVKSRAKSRTEQYSRTQGSSSRMSYESETGASEGDEVLEGVFLTHVHLRFTLESGRLLPLVMKGRLNHNRHFTFKSVDGDLAITFVTEFVQGTHATRLLPFVKYGSWLQVLITEEMISKMIEEFSELADKPDEIVLPKTYNFPDYNMTITIVKD